MIEIPEQGRQETHDLSLAAFIATINGQQAPDRTLAHELTVQETLLRATGGVVD